VVRREGKFQSELNLSRAVNIASGLMSASRNIREGIDKVKHKQQKRIGKGKGAG
jgi:hypothetical protein